MKLKSTFQRVVGIVKLVLPIINKLRLLPFPVVVFFLTFILLTMVGMAVVDGMMPDAVPDQFDLNRIQRMLDAL